MFVSPPRITNVEWLSQSTISSLDNGSFGRNRTGVNIQQPTTLEVANTETMMDYNEDLYTPTPHDISNMFAVAYFSSHLSYD